MRPRLNIVSKNISTRIPTHVNPVFWEYSMSQLHTVPIVLIYNDLRQDANAVNVTHIDA